MENGSPTSSCQEGKHFIASGRNKPLELKAGCSGSRSGQGRETGLLPRPTWRPARIPRTKAQSSRSFLNRKLELIGGAWPTEYRSSFSLAEVKGEAQSRTKPQPITQAPRKHRRTYLQRFSDLTSQHGDLLHAHQRPLHQSTHKVSNRIEDEQGQDYRDQVRLRIESTDQHPAH